MLGSQKTGSGRIKVFRKEWYFHGKVVTHNTRDIPRSLSKDMIYLSRSLVTMTYGCKVLLIIVTKPVQRTFSSKDLTKDEVETAQKLIKETISNFDSTFAIRGVKGRMILLRKICPYECKVCHRHHDNENPLIIVRENGRIDFYCRRGKASVNIASMPMSNDYVAPVRRTTIRQAQPTSSVRRVSANHFGDISRQSMDIAKDPRFNLLEVQRYLLS